MHQRHVLHVLAICAFAVIAYLPSFDVGFVFDDVPNIVTNPTIQQDTAADLVRGGVSRGQEGFISQRPVAMYSFALNHLFSQLDPFAYHLTNLVIHLLNATVLYALLIVLQRAREPSVAIDKSLMTLAFTGALLWAVHPVNTQAVTYIVQRMTSLCAMFYLLSILVFVCYRLGRVRLAVAAPLILALFGLGMGTKPIMITLPAALLILDLFITGRWKKEHVVAVCGIAGVAIVATLLWGMTSLGQFTETYPKRDFSGYERLLTQGRVLVHYLGLWFWPDPARLQLDYEFGISRAWLEPATTVLAWMFIAIVSVVAAVGAKRAPWPAFAWFFFLVASSVEASFLNLELVFEHRMYLPSVFIIPAVVSLIPHVARARALIAIPLLLVAGVLSLATIERNRDWASSEGFWMEELQRGASLARAGQNAAMRYSMVGRPENAIAVIERSLPHATGISHVQMMQQKGEAHLALDQLEAADTALSEVHVHAPNWTRNRYFLGQVALQKGEKARAARIAANLSEDQPSSAFALALRALVLQDRGNAEQAAALLHERLADPDHRLEGNVEAFLRLHLANAYRALDRTQAAYNEYRRIVDTDPHNWTAWAYIYQMLEAGGDDEQAARVKRYLDERGVDISTWAQ